MKLPLTAWKNTLSALGYRVVRRKVDSRINRRKKSRVNESLNYGPLEPRKLLATAPELGVLNSLTVDEGQTFSVSVSYADPDVGDTHTATIDWGDGTAPETVDANGGLVEVTHDYGDDGTYQAILTLTDSEQLSDQETFDVTVNNVAPVVHADHGSHYHHAEVFGDEGSGVTIVGLFIDPSSSDTFTAFLYPDGTAGESIEIDSDIIYTWTSGSQNVTSVWSGVTLDSGQYDDAVIRLYDDDGGFADREFSMTITNVAPTLTVTPSATELDEGSSLTLDLAATDPGDDTISQWVIDWGDGSVVSYDGTETSVDHVYTDNGEYQISVTATDEDGSYSLLVDTSFGDGGVAAADFTGATSDYVYDAVEQPDGKILVAGRAYQSGNGNLNFALSRYLADGSVDTDFGDGGTVLTDLGSSDYAQSVAVQQLAGDDFRIFLTGYSGGRSVIAAYTDAGVLDTSFGGGGKLVLDLPGVTSETLYDVSFQPDGKIIAAGRGYNSSTKRYDFTVVRLDADGSLDTSFGSDGIVTTNFGAASHDYGYHVAYHDGKLIVAGQAAGNFGVARYNADGTLDSSFGGDGLVTTDLGGSTDYVEGLLVQQDGKIVIGGSGSSGSGSYYYRADFALVRYNVDGSLDTSFGDQDGVVLTDLGGYNRVNSMTTDASGGILLGGNRHGNQVVVRYDADGNFDADFGVLKPGGSNVASLVSTQDGNLLVVGNTTLTKFQAKQSVTVNNVAPTLLYAEGETDEGEYDYFVEGDSINLYAGFVDPSPSDTYTALFFPEGLSGQSIALSASVYQFGGQNQIYVSYGDYGGDGLIPHDNGLLQPVIRLTDDDGGVVDHVFDLDIQEVAPTISVSSTATTVDEGSEFTIDFSAVDPGDDTVSQWLVNWGDGNVTSHPGTATTATHVYNDNGQYPVTVEATDEDGSYVASLLLDSSFGNGGVVAGDFRGAIYDYIYATAEQPDGKILVAGRGYQADDGGYNFALSRYEADGSLDTDFGNDGTILTDLGSSDYGYSLAIQPLTGDSFRILLGGTSSSKFAIAAYNEDGSLDSSFAGGGTQVIDLPGVTGEHLSSLLVQPDGKIVAAGRSYVDGTRRYDFTLVRLDSDGDLDSGFGSGGLVTTNFATNSYDYGYGLAYHAGKLIVAGYGREGSNYDFAIARYNADGSLDASFGGDGKVTTDFAAGNDYARSVIALDDGRIVVGGYAYGGTEDRNDFAMVRYNVDGSLDTSFGIGGRVLTAFEPGSYDTATKMTLDQQGNILLAGTTSGRQVVVRYNADGMIDTSFGENGRQLLSAKGSVASLLGTSDGNFVIASNQYVAGTGNQPTLTKIHSNKLVTVNNVASQQISISGVGVAEVNAPYELQLSAGDLGISDWLIEWGDGTIEEFPGVLDLAQHIYQSVSNASVRVNALIGGVVVAQANIDVEVQVASSEGEIRFDAIEHMFIQPGEQLSASVGYTYGDGVLEDVIVEAVGTVPVGLEVQLTGNVGTALISWIAPEGDGEYTVTLEARDSNNLNVRSRTTFRVIVGSSNLAPVVLPIESLNVTTGQEVRFSIAAIDDGPDYQLRYSLGEGAPADASVGVLSGQFTWEPDAIHAGNTYVVDVEVTDAGSPARTTILPVSINVLDVGGVVPVAEGTALSGNVLNSVVGNYEVVAIESDGLLVDQLMTLDSGATLQINSDGQFSYDSTGSETIDALGQGENLTDTLSITIRDLADNELTALVSFQAIGENDSPVAVENVYEVSSGDSLNGNLIFDSGPAGGRDSDVDGDSLSIKSIDGVSLVTGSLSFLSGLGATVTVAADGALNYDPSSIATETTIAGNILADSFAYTLSDGATGGTSTAIVQISVYVESNRPTQLTENMNFGLADDTGFILYTEASVHSDPRFGTRRPHASNSDHLLGVRYNLQISQWEYSDNTDGSWAQFVPIATDRLLAKVNYSSDVVTSLVGSQANIFGIEAGYSDGNLAFVSNVWNGAENPGEVGVTGTYFEIAGTQATSTFELTEGSPDIVSGDLSATGSGYVLLSQDDVHSRFDGNDVPAAGSSDHLLIVRFNASSQTWEYSRTDNSVSSWVSFTVVDSDRLVAAVNFTSDSVTSLENSFGNVFGIDSGFQESNLQFEAVTTEATRFIRASFDSETGNVAFVVYPTTGAPSTVSIGDPGAGIAVDDFAQSLSFNTGQHTTTDPVLNGSFHANVPSAHHYLVEIDADYDIKSGSDVPSASIEIVLPASEAGNFEFSFDPGLSPDFPAGAGERWVAYRVSARDQNGNLIEQSYFDNETLDYTSANASTEWLLYQFEVVALDDQGEIRVDDVRLLYESGTIDLESGNVSNTSTTNDPRIYGKIDGDFAGKSVRIDFTHERFSDDDFYGEMESFTGSVELSVNGEFIYDPRTVDAAFAEHFGSITVNYTVAVIDPSNNSETAIVTNTFSFYHQPTPALSANINVSIEQDTEGGYTGAGYRVTGTITGLASSTDGVGINNVDVEFDYASVDQEFDGRPDASTTALEPQEDSDGNVGSHQIDYRLTGVSAAATVIRIRARQWDDSLGAYRYSEWTDRTLPGLTGVSISHLGKQNETANGRLVPNLEGRLEGSPTDAEIAGGGEQVDLANVSFVKVEFFNFSGDIPDDSNPVGFVFTDRWGYFSYSPTSLQLGSNVFQARTVQSLSDGSLLHGATRQTSFSVSAASLPTIGYGDFHLLMPDNAQRQGNGSLLTDDPRVTGTVTDTGGVPLDAVHVEFAIDRGDVTGDEDEIVGTASLDADGRFNFYPDTTVGLQTIKARVVFQDTLLEESIRKQTGSWSEVFVTVESRQNVLSTIEDFELVDSDNASPPHTSNPVIQGQVVNPDGYVGNVKVEVRDVDRDTIVATTYTNADGQFTYKLDELPAGIFTIAVRAKDWDYGSQTDKDGEWSSPLTFVVVAPPSVSQSVSHFKLRSDSGVSQTDTITANSLLYGEVTSDAGVSDLVIAIDAGGVIAATVRTDELGRFSWQPTALANGVHSYRARIATWNAELGDYEYSAGLTTQFTLENQANNPAKLVALQLANQPSSGPVTDATIVGRIVNEGSLGEVTIEFGRDADDTVFSSTTTDGLGNFSFRPELSTGNTNLKVRTREFDAATSAYLVSAWVPLTSFNYQPINQQTPSIDNLAFGYVGNQGRITGHVANSIASDETSVEISLAENGATISTVDANQFNGSFQFEPSGLNFGETYTYWLRAKVNASDGPVYSDAESIEFTWTPQRDDLRIEGLQLAVDTADDGGTSSDGVSNDTRIAGTLISDGDVADYEIQLDTDNNGSVDLTIAPDQFGNFLFDEFVPEEPGYYSVRVRAQSTDSYYDRSNWARLNFIFDTDDGSSASQALAEALTTIDAAWQTADLNFDQDTAQSISDAIYAAAAENAESDYDFELAAAEQQRLAVEAALRAEYQQQQSAAQAAYQAALVVARQAFISSLNDLPEDQRIAFELDDFQWPDRPEANDRQEVASSANPTTPAKPTYTGAEFSEEFDPVYQRALANAQQTYSEAIRTAERAKQDAIEAAEETHKSDVEAANEAYQDAVDAANDRYDQLREEGRPDPIDDQVKSITDQIRDAQEDFRDKIAGFSDTRSEKIREADDKKRDELRSTDQDERDAQQQAYDDAYDDDCEHPDSGNRIEDSGTYSSACGGDGGDSTTTPPDNHWEYENGDGPHNYDQTQRNSPPEDLAYRKALVQIDKQFAPKYESILNAHDNSVATANKTYSVDYASALKSLRTTIYSLQKDLAHLYRDFHHANFEDGLNDLLELTKDLADAKLELESSLVQADVKRDKAIADAEHDEADAIAEAEKEKTQTTVGARQQAFTTWDQGVQSPWSAYQSALADSQRDYDFEVANLAQTRDQSIADALKEQAYIIADAKGAQRSGLASAEKQRTVDLAELTTTFRIDVDSAQTDSSKELADNWLTRRTAFANDSFTLADKLAGITEQYAIESSEASNKYTTSTGGHPGNLGAGGGWAYSNVIESRWWFGDTREVVDNTDERERLDNERQEAQARITRDRTIDQEDANETFHKSQIDANKDHRISNNATLHDTTVEIAGLRADYDIAVGGVQQTYTSTVAGLAGALIIAEARGEAVVLHGTGNADATFELGGAPLSATFNVGKTTAEKGFFVEEATAYRQQLYTWAGVDVTPWEQYQIDLASADIDRIGALMGLQIEHTTQVGTGDSTRVEDEVAAQRTFLDTVYGPDGAYVKRVETIVNEQIRLAGVDSIVQFTTQQANAVKSHRVSAAGHNQTFSDAWAETGATYSKAVSAAQHRHNREDARIRYDQNKPDGISYTEANERRQAADKARVKTGAEAGKDRAIAMAEARGAWTRGMGDANVQLVTDLAGVQDNQGEGNQNNTNALARVTANAEKAFRTEKADAELTRATAWANAYATSALNEADADRDLSIAAASQEQAYVIASAIANGTYAVSLAADHLSNLTTRHQAQQDALSLYQLNLAQAEHQSAIAGKAASVEYASRSATIDDAYSRATQNSTYGQREKEINANQVADIGYAQGDTTRAHSTAAADADYYIASEAARALLTVTQIHLQGITDIEYAKAVRDRNNKIADAGIAFVTAAACAHKDLTIGSISHSEHSDRIEAARQVQQDAIQAANEAFNEAIDSSEEQPNVDLGQARIDYVTAVQDAKIDFVNATNDANVTAAENERDVDVHYIQTVSRARVGHENRLASANKTRANDSAELDIAMAEQGRIDSVQRATDRAIAEVNYHVSKAAEDAQLWQQLAQGPGATNDIWFKAIEATSLSNWIVDLGDEYVELEAELARVEGQKEVDNQTALAYLNTRQLNANSAFTVGVENQKSNFRINSRISEVEARVVEANSTALLNLSSAEAEQKLAIARVNAVVQYDNALHTIDNQNRDNSNSEAAREARRQATYQRDKAFADADFEWRNDIGSAEFDFADAKANREYGKSTEYADLQKKLEVSVAGLRQTLEIANAQNQANFWVDETTIANRVRYDESIATTTFIANQHASRISATANLTSFATGDLQSFTAWADFQQQKAVSDADAWQTNAVQYLQSMVQLNNANAQNAQQRRSAYVSSAAAVANANRQFHVSLANVTHDHSYDTADAEAHYARSLANLVGEYRTSTGTATHVRDVAVAEAARDQQSTYTANDQFNQRINEIEQGFESQSDELYSQRAQSGGRIGQSLVRASGLLGVQLAQARTTEQRDLDAAILAANEQSSVAAANIQYQYALFASGQEISAASSLASDTPSPWADLALADAQATDTNIVNTLSTLTRDQQIQRADAHRTYELAVSDAKLKQVDFKASLSANKDLSEAASLVLQLAGGTGDGELPGDLTLPTIDLGSVNLISRSFLNHLPGTISGAWYGDYYGYGYGFGYDYGYYDGVGYGGYGYGSFGFSGYSFDGYYSGYNWFNGGFGADYGYGGWIGSYSYGGYGYSYGAFSSGGWSSGYGSVVSVNVDVSNQLAKFNAQINQINNELSASEARLTVPQDDQSLEVFGSTDLGLSIPGGEDNLVSIDASVSELNNVNLPESASDQVIVLGEDRPVRPLDVVSTDPTVSAELRRAQTIGKLLDAFNGYLDFEVAKLSFGWGVYKGFLYDGLYGTATGAASLIGTLGSWAYQATTAVSKAQYEYGKFVYSYYTGGLDSANDTAVGRGINGTVDVANDLGTKLGPYVKAIYNDLDVLTGESNRSLSPETMLVIETSEEIVDTVGQVFEEFGDSIADDWKRKSLDEKAEILGRITGAILFEVASAGVAAGAKAAKLGKFARFLDDLPLGLNPAAKQRIVNVVEDATILIARRLNLNLCFAAGTLVHTDQGLKPIESIEIGDKVLTRSEHGIDSSANDDLPEAPFLGLQSNGQSGLAIADSRTCYREVLRLFKTTPDSLQQLTISDGVREETIATTFNHPFFAVDQQEFVNAETLKPGDRVRLSDGRSATVVGNITEYAEDGESFETFNFEVDDTHTYFVGEFGVWVHNAGTTICQGVAQKGFRVLEKGGSHDEMVAALHSAIRHESRTRTSAASKKASWMQQHFEDALDGIARDPDVRLSASDIQRYKDQFAEVNGLNVRTRLPRTDGDWTSGVPGSGEWTSEIAAVNKITGDRPVQFRNGRPDFSPWLERKMVFKKGKLDGTAKDFDVVHDRLMKTEGLKSRTEAKAWLKEKGLTAHHATNNTIQLIPSKLHNNIPHIGSASDLRLQRVGK